MSGHCPECGTYHEEDDDRLCGKCRPPQAKVLASNRPEVPTAGKTHLEILKHALGLNRSLKEYRNFFDGQGTDNEPVCEELCNLGYMRRGMRIDGADGHMYRVTERGKEWAKARA